MNDQLLQVTEILRALYKQRRKERTVFWFFSINMLVYLTFLGGVTHATIKGMNI